ncbi:MAG: GTPase HflX [Lachnospiraceae bacterium]
MPFYENEQNPERALLLGVDTGEYDCAASLAELEELSRTAGAEVVGTVSQKLPNPNPATYIGSGRMEEVCAFCRANEVDLIVADGELAPAQQRNIEAQTDTRVIDRTTLILDIFAQRARSREGKIQVELAQLRYMLPRLTGRGKAMSRLGGGIGTRGPGESKLESDKRHIRRRIYALEEDLRQMEKRRNALRTRRKKDGVIAVAIVGYTNAGKSTLMNNLTEAGVLAEDKLFATLDPTARRLTLPNGQDIMLIDTVGLVRRLPHHLVEAFKSTLEEAKAADLILNVCDASDPACAEHISVTERLLSELGCTKTPMITVMNKCDRVPALYELPTLGKTVHISARTGGGISNLLSEIEKAVCAHTVRVTLLIPFSEGQVLARIRRDGAVLSETYLPEGTRAEVIIDTAMLEELRAYLERID